MLHSFYCKNMFSFRDRQELSFKVGASAPYDQRFTEADQSILNTRFSKIAVIIGHNGSGKSKLLQAISFAKWFILNSYSGNPGYKIPFDPFLLPLCTDTSEFGLVMEYNNVVYDYQIEFTQERVLREMLKCRHERKASDIEPADKNLETRRQPSFSQVFSRTWNEKNNEYIIKKPQLEKSAYKFTRTLWPNATLVSALRRQCKEPSGLDGFIEALECIITNMGYEGKRHPGLHDYLNCWEKTPELAKKAMYLIENFDIGMYDVSIKKNKNNNVSLKHKIAAAHQIQSDANVPEKARDFAAKAATIFEIIDSSEFLDGHGESYVMEGLHRVGSKAHRLPMMLESQGTLALLGLLVHVVKALESGGMLIYDEIETNLHPLVMEGIFNIFLSSSLNPLNAQLICSTHNDLVLNLVDKTQIFIVEKGKDLVSFVKTVDSRHRRDTPFVEKYLMGIYGGVMNR